MSYKGSPYYDAALDGGYRGEEAEQVAAVLEEEHRREYERQWQREAEAREQEEAEADVAAPPVEAPEEGAVTVDYLECPHCGCEAAESDADGMFQEDSADACMTCGFPGGISIEPDGGEAWWNGGDEPGARCAPSGLRGLSGGSAVSGYADIARQRLAAKLGLQGDDYQYIQGVEDAVEALAQWLERLADAHEARGAIEHSQFTRADAAAVRELLNEEGVGDWREGAQRTRWRG